MRPRLALSPKRGASAAILAACALIIALLTAQQHPWWASAILAAGLAWVAMIDVERLVLPDTLTLGLMSVGLAIAPLDGWTTSLDSVIGAIAGYLTLAVVAYVYQRVRGIDGLGGGDAKLLAAGGAWLGWMALPTVLLVASLLGLIFAFQARARATKLHVDDKIAFGPFISIGIWFVWCWFPGT